MRVGESWAYAITPALMLALSVPVAGAAAAETGLYAPEHIEQTYKELS
jgi:hypothetical protein